MCPRTRYHHGDLRTALIDATIELIAERGIAAFSMAEASRRLGVAASAPYRHFANRDELLEAAAIRGAEALTSLLATVPAGPPTDRLAAAAEAYVRFAAEWRPLYEVLFAAGLHKHHYPRLVTAAAPVVEAFGGPAEELAPGHADRLAGAVIAVAHGHAALLADGALGADEAAVRRAAGLAGRAVRALIAGRAELTGPV